MFDWTSVEVTERTDKKLKRNSSDNDDDNKNNNSDHHEEGSPPSDYGIIIKNSKNNISKEKESGSYQNRNLNKMRELGSDRCEYFTSSSPSFHDRNSNNDNDENTGIENEKETHRSRNLCRRRKMGLSYCNKYGREQ